MDDRRDEDGTLTRAEELRRALYAPNVEARVVAEYRAALDATHPDTAGDPLEASPAHPEPDPEPSDAAGSMRGPVSLRRRVVGIATVAAFVLGVLAGAAVVWGRQPGGAEAQAARPRGAGASSSASPSSTQLGIFAVPQQADDRPTGPIGSQLVRASFRQLESISTSGTVMYAAKNADGQVCLVASMSDQFLASCATASEFLRTPLTLDFEAAVHGHGQQPDEVVAYWSAQAGSGWTNVSR